MDFASSQHSPQRHDYFADERVIPAGDALINATLTTRPEASGVVALLHASSTARFGQQSRFAAEVMAQAGLSTVQVDLLTPEEDSAPLQQREMTGSSALLLSRVTALVCWLQEQPETTRLPVCLFATSEETLAALMAAERLTHVVAVVSRGGAPAPAPELLAGTRAPTLLLLGSEEQARAAELAAEFFVRRLRALA